MEFSNKEQSTPLSGRAKVTVVALVVLFTSAALGCGMYAPRSVRSIAVVACVLIATMGPQIVVSLDRRRQREALVGQSGDDGRQG